MSKRPLVVIAGLPNVGKSTLFNKLIGRRKAIVHRLAGMTRDSVREKVIHEERIFDLADTGGFFEEEGEMILLTREKAMDVAREAQLALLVLDGRREVLPLERELYRLLKKIGIPILVVVNKTENVPPEKIDSFLTEKNPFNEEALAVSAEHSEGLYELLDTIVEKVTAPDIGEDNDHPLKVAIVGKTNVGKSSLLNALSGKERAIVSAEPNTTRDVLDELVVFNKQPFLIMDTAGIRKLKKLTDERAKAAIIKAEKTIPEADVVLFILDAGRPFTRQDQEIARLIHESGKPVATILNKWDLAVEKSTPGDLEELYKESFPFLLYSPRLLTSAISGKNLPKIWELLLRVYENYGRRIPTPELNRVFAELHNKTPLLTVNSDALKVKYVTQVHAKPPVFVLFSSRAEKLMPSAEKYLDSFFRQCFPFEGTPLRFVVRKK